MTFDRAMALLVSRRGRGLCGRCLATELGTTETQTRALFLKLGQRRAFTCEFGTCDMCEKHRLVVTADRSAE